MYKVLTGETTSEVMEAACNMIKSGGPASNDAIADVYVLYDQLKNTKKSMYGEEDLAAWGIIQAYCQVPDSARRKSLEKPSYPGEGSALLRAHGLVYGDRAKAYGPAKDQFNKIGEMAGLMLSEDDKGYLLCGTLTAEIVCKVMIATKLVRESYKPKQDNRDDACGYIDLLDQIVGGK